MRALRFGFVENMRWCDLEHELIHIEVLLARILSEGIKLSELKPWQVVQLEYHTRLLEFLGMVENGADEELIKEHAQHLVIWSNRFWQKGRGLGKSEVKAAWQQQYLPDLDHLRQSANQVFIEKGLQFSEFEISELTKRVFNPYGIK